MKLPKTQRTRDLSTFDKEATKTHLQTNYFQALTNKLQAVGKGSSPTKKGPFLTGGGLGGSLHWHLQRQESQLEKLVCSNNEKRLSGELKKQTYFPPFTSSHFHISNSRPGK